MQVLKATEKNIAVASEIVRNGGLVVYPTETVYGLGCDPLNIQAVKRVFQVKGERNKPLPILASSIENVEKVAYLSENAKCLATKFWPGPLTIILRKKPFLPDVVTCNENSVGVRIPKHDVAVKLVQLSNGLLIGTSANKTEKKSPKTVEEATKQIGKEVDVILDGGPACYGISSTLIDFTSVKPNLLREGPISLKEISAVLPK